jgi:hypothetical protein
MGALWHSGEGVLTLRQDSPHIRLMFPASCSGICSSAWPLLPVHNGDSQRNWKRAPQPRRVPYRCFTTLAWSLIDGLYARATACYDYCSFIAHFVCTLRSSIVADPAKGV